MKAHPSNKCGYRGVHRTENDRYLAAVTVHGIRHRLGVFDTPEEAHAVYTAKKEELTAEKYGARVAQNYVSISASHSCEYVTVSVKMPRHIADRLESACLVDGTTIDAVLLEAAKKYIGDEDVDN